MSKNGGRGIVVTMPRLRGLNAHTYSADGRFVSAGWAAKKASLLTDEQVAKLVHWIITGEGEIDDDIRILRKTRRVQKALSQALQEMCARVIARSMLS